MGETYMYLRRLSLLILPCLERLSNLIRDMMFLQAVAQPMDCEERLVTQAEMYKTGHSLKHHMKELSSITLDTCLDVDV